MKTNIPEPRNGPDYPRSRMQYRIQSVEEAKAFLLELWENNESYHPEDDANDIAWRMPEDQQPDAEECEALNECMEQIYALPGTFDPCGYLLDLDWRKDYHVEAYENETGFKVSQPTEEERNNPEVFSGDYGQVDKDLLVRNDKGQTIQISFNDGKFYCTCENVSVGGSLKEIAEDIQEAFICVYGEDKDALETFLISSSNGQLEARADTGWVIRCDMDKDGEGIDLIERFDVAEFRKHYKVEVLPSTIDILDLGYWLKGGMYTGPELDWREEFRRGQDGKILDVYHNVDDDQPTTCPRCGARTEFEQVNAIRQEHTCEPCKYSFFLDHVEKKKSSTYPLTTRHQIKLYTIEELFDIDEEESSEEVVTVAELRPLINDIDTVLELVRVSWDNPTPQATKAINDAWADIRDFLSKTKNLG